MLLGVNQTPRPGLFGGVFPYVVRRIVVLGNPPVEIIGLPDVELPVGVLQDINKEAQTPRGGLEPPT